MRWRAFALGCCWPGAAATPLAVWTRLQGDDAPNLEIKTWFNKAEGSSVEDFRGKAVLLEFWATW